MAINKDEKHLVVSSKLHKDIKMEALKKGITIKALLQLWLDNSK